MRRAVATPAPHGGAMAARLTEFLPEPSLPLDPLYAPAAPSRSARMAISCHVSQHARAHSSGWRQLLACAEHASGVSAPPRSARSRSITARSSPTAPSRSRSASSCLAKRAPVDSLHRKAPSLSMVNHRSTSSASLGLSAPTSSAMSRSAASFCAIASAGQYCRTTEALQRRNLATSLRSFVCESFPRAPPPARRGGRGCGPAAPSESLPPELDESESDILHSYGLSRGA